MEALYAFLRLSDDLADDPGSSHDRRAVLQDWRRQLELACRGEFLHPILPALHDTIQRFSIPEQYLFTVLDGLESDLTPASFDTFDQLRLYCYQVASVVGLSCIHIWGFRGKEAIPLAVDAGIAFQLTNILRDLREDREAGRVYLPSEDWKRFDCPPAQWRADAPNFQGLMRFEVERARAFYTRGDLLRGFLSSDGRAVFGAMSGIYRALLDEIQARNFDVWSGRVSLSRRRKLRVLARSIPVRLGWS